MESPGSFSDGHFVGCSFLCSSSIPRGALVLLPALSAVLDGGCGLAILFIASFVSSPLSRFFFFIFSTSIVLRTEPFLHGLYKAACSRLIHVLLCHFLHSPFVILATKTKQKKNSCRTFSLDFGGSFISVPCRPGISFLCYIVTVVRFPVKGFISWKEPPFLTLYVSHTKSLKLRNSCTC